MQTKNIHYSSILTIIALNLLACLGGLAQPLTLDLVYPNHNGAKVYVEYSRSVCMEPSSAFFGATHVPNYTFTPLTTIAAATLLLDGRTVMLDVSPPLSGNCTLTVNALAGAPITSCNGFTNLTTPVTKHFSVGADCTAPKVNGVIPAHFGTDCGSTLTAIGCGFDALATMTLFTGPSAPVAGSGIVVNNTGEITATFPGGLVAGRYDLVVANPPGGTVFPGLSTPPYSIWVKPPELLTAWPNIAMQCFGGVVISAAGSGICPAATFTAKEHGGATVVTGTGVTVHLGQDVIKATFDFSSAPVGFYDLIVQNPGGATLTLPNWVNVSGLSVWHVSPKKVGVCSGVQLEMLGALCPGDNVRLTPVGGGTSVPGTVVSVVANTYYGSVMTATFDLSSSAPRTYRPEFQRGSGTWLSFSTWLNIEAVNASPCPLDIEIGGRTTVGYSVVNPFSVTIRNLSCSTVAASTLTVSLPAAVNPSFSLLSGGGNIAPFNVITYSVPTLSAGDSHTVSFNLSLPTVGDTASLSALSSASGCGPVEHGLTVVVSQDPNYKLGPTGCGSNHRIRGDEVLSYEIHFENDPVAATAPAQDVIVADRLLPTHFDLTTFALGPIAFGDQTVTPPAGSQRSSTILPLQVAGGQMLLLIEARLVADPLASDYGRVTWSYRSLAPDTLATPLNPLLGFLPPNQFPPEGEGSVKFTVKARPGLATGTQIGSAAAIVFDRNAPMTTEPWGNEIAPCDQDLAIPSAVSYLSVRCCVDGNTLQNLFPAVPSGAEIRTYNATLQSYDPPAVFSGTWSPSFALPPAKGFRFDNPGSLFTAQLRGVIPDAVPFPVLLPGRNLVGTPFDSAATFEQITGRQPVEGDELDRWNGMGFDVFTILGSEWDPFAPSVAPGTSVFVVSTGPLLAPALQIRILGTQVEVSWPGDTSSDWRLQTTMVLGTEWSFVPGVPALTPGGRWAITLPHDDSHRFFRLRHP